MVRKWISFLLALLIMGSGTMLAEEENRLYVKRIDHLPEDFILGMDVSSVISLENSGVIYRDRAGTERDLFELLAEKGINYIRVRIWNDPYTADGRGYGGGNCDLATAAEIGRRAAEHGMKLLVDFHYSDFWADPSKQMAPKAWQGMSIEEKEDALYAWTLESLKTLQNSGSKIGMVQIGNETNGRFCGEKIWMNIIWHLMAAGCRAIRTFDPEVKIAVHFANPENADAYLNWASKLAYYDLDYDVFATSYYPYWHGTLENLKEVLSEIKETYDKEVLVAETSYAYTLEDTDFSGNTIGAGGAYDHPWPFTVQGQANEIREVAAAINEIGGMGLFYWEGAWITVGGHSYEENSLLWEKYGCGWASSAAGEYDPNDAGKYYGGSACDNQALFGPDGRALESLEVFQLLREGQEIPLESGRWEYQISIMGGDAGNQEIYSYVKVNGEIIDTCDSKITSYNVWDTPRLIFDCKDGDHVVCGIFVRCDGAGAWGKIDDMIVSKKDS